MPLKEVFVAIFKKEDGKKTISHKSSAKELKELLKAVLADYDEERVYVSDIKKLVNWYNLLVDNGLIDLEKDNSENAEASVEEEKTDDSKEEASDK